MPYHRSLFRKVLPILVIFVAILCARVIFAQSPKSEGRPSEAQFSMGPRYVLMPEGYFVLVRRGSEIGAIRLTEIAVDSMGNGRSIYESYYQGDGTLLFIKPNVVKHTGEITAKPVKSISHSLTWFPGQKKLFVGKWWFYCYTPQLINMTLHLAENDSGFEFAPTSARTLEEIDATDSRLRWFRYDPDSSVEVPVSGLPK